MAALHCHDVLHICLDTRLLPTERPTQDHRRLPKDQLPRRVLVRMRTDVSVRSEKPFRADLKSSVAPAPPLLLGRGQQLRTDGARRSPFCRSIWLHQVPVSGRSTARARVVVGDARARLTSRVSGPFLSNLQMSFVAKHTHRSMIDVADVSIFLLLQTPS